MTIQQDVAQTWHDAVIELFELDLSMITGSAGDKYYFTSELMPDNTKIQWKGQVYEPLPIAASGFEKSTKGQLPTPELTVANVLGTLASVVNTLNDLIGAKITRRRTLFKYLDGSSAPDPSQEFPDDIFYIERKIAENSITITWQLASKIDLEGLQLPKRIITQNYCLWKYRGPECGYTGPAVANEFDGPISVGGVVSPEGAAYIAAFEAFYAAKRNFVRAETNKNLAFGRKEAACDPFVATRSGNVFVFNNNSDFGLTFAIQDGDGNTIAAVWNGEPVNTTGNSNFGLLGYTTGYKQNTGRGPGVDNNGTGDAFMVRRNGVELPFTNGTFAIKDENNVPIFFVNGQRVIGGGGISYQLGSYASPGFAPMRSMSTLAYANSECAAKTEEYENAVTTYDAAAAALSAAQAALTAAYAALPMNDEVAIRDRCGKRLQSCRLRFQDGHLPFGGFPGANITR